MSTPQSQHARRSMLQSQLMPGRILQPAILSAFSRVNREAFVPTALKSSAYVDQDLPLGDNRFLLEPLIFARMLEHAQIKPSETVMIIASATGYSAAILSTLAQHVVAVEELDSLYQSAKTNLAGYRNVQAIHAPLASGFQPRAPYDIIFIEGAIDAVPQSLVDQLREKGRIFAVKLTEPRKLGTTGGGKLLEYTKVKGRVYPTVLEDASAYALSAFTAPPSFTF